MRWVLQLFAIILFLAGAFTGVGACVAWPLAVILLVLDSMWAKQNKILQNQQAMTQPVQTAANAQPHWRDLEKFLSSRCGIYRIREDPRTFIDAKGNLIQHESADALRVNDPLSIRTVWPDGEDNFVIGVFFEGKMIGVLPAQLEREAREMLAKPNTQLDATAQVYHIDLQARDAVVLGFFNLTPTVRKFDPDAKPKTREEQVYTAIVWIVIVVAAIGIAVALMAG